MKLAFSTLPCEGWSVKQIVDMCGQGGFQGVEIREAAEPPLSLTQAPGKLREYSAAFREAGIAVTDIASGLCLTGGPEERPAAVEYFRRLTEFAGIFQAAGIRIFLGNFCAQRDDPRRELDVPALTETVRLLGDVAAGAGIRVWIETHNEYATGKKLAELLADAGPGCGAIWDILHPVEDGETPEETLRALSGYCVHVHIKDGRPPTDPMLHDWTYTEIGKGELSVGKIVALLQAAGYDGFYSCEWESKWRPELRRPGMETARVLSDYAAFMRSLPELRHRKEGKLK